jgi:hypothetical protein
MRHAGLLCTVAVALLAANHVRAQQVISIDDTLEGTPVVIAPPGATVITDIEQATVTLPNTFGLPAFSTSWVFMEPTSDPFGPRVSDYFTLSGTANTISLFFASDGAPDYGKNFPSPPYITSTENASGLPATLTVFQAGSLPSSGLEVSVISDFNSPEVPDSAPTIGCLGLALMVLAGFGRKVGVCC